ncbi:MAG: tyrosinase [Actinomycetota bacterium]|nr:tyrosinase [Actinomycetota bacterium]
MRTEIALNGNERPDARFIGWSPVPAAIRLSDTTGATGPVKVRLRNQNTTKGGQVVFFSSIPGTGQDQLDVTLPTNGRSVKFQVAGRFQRPSIDDRDATVEVIDVGTNQILGSKPIMVRVRKNAMVLTTGERNRFIAAFATLNDRGRGRFADFRNVHTSAGDPEAHGRAGFLPWHRAFLLDLERELQLIDASVALPYWRFDQPAPKVFNRDFMGVPDPSTGTVQFSPSNPLQFWATDGTTGINRRPLFNTQTQAAQSLEFGPAISEANTLALGNRFLAFRGMEGNPHGSAHISFTGSISSIPTAAKDPLFFMLHANVDRLWAKWQWVNHRFDVTDVNTFTFLGKAGDAGSTRVGHNLKDTMWPWNQVITSPRPATAPGGTMAPSPLVNVPGLRPTVGSMVDFQGVLTPGSRLGFDYDDVPFEFIVRPTP